MRRIQTDNSGKERPPATLPHLAGRYIEDPRQAFLALKSKLGSIVKRVGAHFLALLAGGIIADGRDTVGQVALFYFGAICLLPRGFSPRRNADLFPCVISLGQLAVTLVLAYPLPLAVFLAGTQNWLQRAVIRRFRLGLDWVPAPFLLGFFVQAVRTYELPLLFFAVTTVCGLGAYYAAQILDRRKLARLEAEALARSETALPLKRFYDSASDLESKAASLPEDLRARTSSIALHGRNILECMGKEKNDAQPGARFLVRYLPAAHKIVDEYIRLEREGRDYQEIQAVLGRVDEILERLERAFKQEHASLLNHDAMQLSAEMQVLDKLLKMDGR